MGSYIGQCMLVITLAPFLFLRTSYKNSIVIIRKHPVSNEEQP